MIVAKTGLKKMPKTCKQCDYRELYPVEGDDICRIAGLFCPWEKKPNGMVDLGKPDWCPLMDVEELSGNYGQLESLERHGRWTRSGSFLRCSNCGDEYYQPGGNAGKSWNTAPVAEQRWTEMGMAELIDREALKEALLERGFYPDIVEVVLESAPSIETTCVGCKWENRKRPQKCSCCRRNKHMKDSYEVK